MLGAGYVVVLGARGAPPEGEKGVSVILALTFSGGTGSRRVLLEDVLSRAALEVSTGRQNSSQPRRTVIKLSLLLFLL
jgi:hypothetical protein